MGVDSDNEGGRPPEGIKSGQHKNELGWDPLGTKQIKQAFDPENQKTTFQPNPNATRRTGTKMKSELANRFAKQIKKSTSTKLLFEEKNDEDSGTMLDENNIL
jgi:hypothetical protein